MQWKGCDIMNMTDIVNLVINSSVSVVIIAYFIFRDYKWNTKLIETLTKIETAIDNLQKEYKSNKRGDKSA